MPAHSDRSRLVSTPFRSRYRGRTRGRLILAAIVLLVGLAGYYFGTQENPITGESQRVGLTPQEEVTLGYNTAPQMIQEMGGAVAASDPRQQRINRLAQRLLATDPRLADSPYRFSFTLLDDPQTINAFALPGGPIFITTALYDRLENEAQLAGVLGHEIGHVIHRHSAERMAQARLGQSLAIAAGIGVSGEGNSGQMAAAAAQMVAQMKILQYGREDELESDAQGLDMLAKAGLDPAAMVGVMNVLESATGSGPRGPNFMSTHPHPEARREQIRRWLDEHRARLPAELDVGEPLR